LKFQLAEQAQDIKDAKKLVLEKGESATKAQAELVLAQKELRAEKNHHASEIESLRADYTELEAHLADRNIIREIEVVAAERSVKELEETMNLARELQCELSELNTNRDALKHLVFEERKKTYEENIAKLDNEITRKKEVDDGSFSAELKEENKILQQALEKIAVEYQREVYSLKESNSFLIAENEKHKKEIENLENGFMERSLRAASEVKELSLDNLEPTSRQDNNKEWEQVDGCFEHLHRSLSILYENKDDSEQFFFYERTGG
jgi:hypothetical protein